jgi:energy-coupling factor transport system permease protein
MGYTNGRVEYRGSGSGGLGSAWRKPVKNFEFLHNVTIGQYLPTGSIIHHLHPAVKMLVAAMLMTAVIISTDMAPLSVSFLIMVIFTKLAKIKVRYILRGVRPAIPIIVFVAVLQVLFSSQGNIGRVFWEFRFIAITTGDFLIATVTALRLVVLILIISLFTLCTDIKELTHGTERLLRPLARLRVPVHELSMIMTVTLRFLPILSDEAENLIKAQVSRGADFGKGRMGFFKRLYRMLPLFVPLLVSALRKAENLALAMEARCYTGGKGRTQLVRFFVRRSDVVAFFIACGTVAAIVAINFSRLDNVIWARLFS